MQGDGSSPGDGADGGTSLRSAMTSEELAAVLDSIVHTRSSREQIRLALRPVCTRARENRVDVAELVKVVKQSFRMSTVASALGHAGERQQTLDRIISVCIDEYYAAR